jgi:hypothetical protein
MVGFVREMILSAGRTIIFIGAIISLLLAVGYLAVPELLKSMSKPVNQLFDIESWLYSNKMVVGVIFAVITLVLFSVLLLVK